jgi:hypothetical protein
MRNGAHAGGGLVSKLSGHLIAQTLPSDAVLDDFERGFKMGNEMPSRMANRVFSKIPINACHLSGRATVEDAGVGHLLSVSYSNLSICRVSFRAPHC